MLILKQLINKYYDRQCNVSSSLLNTDTSLKCDINRDNIVVKPYNSRLSSIHTNVIKIIQNTDQNVNQNINQTMKIPMLLSTSLLIVLIINGLSIKLTSRDRS
jgi:hypothetical protein